MKSHPNRRLMLQACTAAAALTITKSAQLLSAASHSQLGWRAGVSREIITPETAVWLAGYGSRRAPEGKLHDLWMKAIALEAPDGKRALLITSDFQGGPA